MSTETLTVRNLHEEEIPALALALPETSVAQLRNRWREQEMGWRQLLVAEQDGRLVGTVSMRVIDGKKPSIHLIALEVSPPERNRGLGGHIVRHVLRIAKRAGCRRVFLDVRADNPAHRLYYRLGFRRVGPTFINTWYLFKDDGTRERVDELSYRMAKRV